MKIADRLRALVRSPHLAVREAEIGFLAAAALDAAEKALEALLDRDEQNTCDHQHTHRGGAIWEICDDCGMKWADDQGGKPEWSVPSEWTNARAALAKLRGEA